jgi:hypothetical protein
MRRPALLPVLLLVLLLGGCAGDGGPAGDSAPTSEDGIPAAPGSDPQRYPDVIDVTVERTGDAYTFTVTISSPYDTPDRYADGWRVLGPDGTVYGEHTLAHDHAAEQPFTRTQTGVSIPGGVTEVTVEGRDQRYGYGGATVTVTLP